MPAAFGTFSALMTNVCLPLCGFLKISSSTAVGTGPEISTAFGSIERMSVPSSQASSPAIIGLRTAYKLPSPSLVTTAFNPAPASSIALE